MRANKGLFITFEKTAEGLGGTTQSHILCDKLKAMGLDVVLTREPGGTPLGQELRKMVLEPSTELSKATSLFLMMADRSQHYKEILKPSLKAGKVVISDRYFDSTLVYQGSGEGWKTAFLLMLHNASTGMLLPDLTIVLDGKPHRALGNDAYEGKGAEFHQKIKEGMYYFASKADRYVIVTANRSQEEVAEDILNIVRARFPQYLPMSTEEGK